MLFIFGAGDEANRFGAIEGLFKAWQVEYAVHDGLVVYFRQPSIDFSRLYEVQSVECTGLPHRNEKPSTCVHGPIDSWLTDKRGTKLGFSFGVHPFLGV